MRIRSIMAACVLTASLVATPGCALFTAQPTPSSQVLSEIRLAETAYLTAITIVTVNSKDGVSPEVKAAEKLVYDFLVAAKEAANKGDTVTVDQKLDLFNAALLKFNQDYIPQ